jgi:hypothetical protein
MGTGNGWADSLKMDGWTQHRRFRENQRFRERDAESEKILGEGKDERKAKGGLCWDADRKDTHGSLS